MYYPGSKNKGADQLRRYCEADLRLCFRISKMLFKALVKDARIKHIAGQFSSVLTIDVSVIGRVYLIACEMIIKQIVTAVFNMS